MACKKGTGTSLKKKMEKARPREVPKRARNNGPQTTKRKRRTETNPRKPPPMRMLKLIPSLRLASVVANPRVLKRLRPSWKK